MRRSNAIAAGLLTSLLASAGGVARAADGSAWLRLDAFSSTRTLDDDAGDGGLEFGLKYAAQLGEDDRLRFDGSVLAGPPERRDAQGSEAASWRLREALWHHRGARLDWWAGQQKITWGKADGLNPTDFFTPHDYSVVQPFEVDQRLSVLAVRADLAVTDAHVLSFVVQPLFTATKLVFPKELVLDDRQPTGLDPQLGLRLSSAGGAFDWSLCAFHGRLNTPLLAFDPAAAGGTPLFEHYANLDAAGLDVARNFGRWGFRAEGAWLQPRAEHGWQGIHPQAFVVAGVDRSGEGWSVNVQGVGRYTPEATGTFASGNPLVDATDRQNAINFGQLHRVQLGFTARLAGSALHETLQAEVLVFGYFRPDNFMVRPLVTYAVTDAARIAAGAEYYAGPEASFFGQLERNRTVFVEYQHFF